MKGISLSLAIALSNNQVSCHRVYQADVQESMAHKNDADGDMMGDPNEFVDMSSLGSKVSSMQLAILNKKQPAQKDATPFDTEMVQTKAAAHNRMRLRATLIKDDMDGDDVTVYQSVANANDDHSLDKVAFS